MKTAILSDIHGNLSALRNVLEDVRKEKVDDLIILGDVIDYGMHSNEVIEVLEGIGMKVLCNIWGNHEYAIMKNDYTRFSSERGVQSARHTKSILNEASFGYIGKMESSGMKELDIDGKKILCIHGDMENHYWGTLRTTSDLSAYSDYDFVLSGHSHIPHSFEQYYKVEDPIMRNKRKCTFINPGSVGQPRNLNNRAQYCIMDFETEEIQFKKVEYDIQSEMDAFDGSVDPFYKERLRYGT